MTKEIEEKVDVKGDNAVSTSDFSHHILQTNSANSNNKDIDKEKGELSISAQESEREVIEVTKLYLGDTMSNGVQASTSDNNDLEGAPKNKTSENPEEIEEEDVPGDFFDDFLKEDFMDGLDIVDDDAWDEDKMKIETTTEETSEETLKVKSIITNKEVKGKVKKKKVKSSEKIDHVERFHASPSGEKRHKQKKKKHEEKSGEQKSRKGKEKVIDADEFDIRRDPEKTKRDIERDKARCEKDKEQKIISEKLSLVETGLVPPGMEMEIDIEEIKKQKDQIDSNKPQRDLREHLRSLRSRSRSATKRQRSPKTSLSRKSVSPPARRRELSPKRRRSKSPIRGRSPIRLSPLRKNSLRRSPLNTSLSRRSPLNVASSRRSPIRRSSPRRSPLRMSRDRNYAEKRSLRRSRSQSPYYRNRRDRHSPITRRHRGRSSSRDSERELWLKRRRSRSRSPRRKREEKKSFLQEIAEKLNETRPPPMMMPPLQQPMHFIHPQPIQSVPVPVPTPVPAPVPTYFAPQPQPPPPPQPSPRPQSQPYDPYDQNFFIGTPQPVGPPGFTSQPAPPVNLPQIQIALNPPKTPQLPTISNIVGNNVQKHFSGPAEATKKTESKEEIAKLFQDKKITLSEFLAITAKPEVTSSSPAHLQEKIKVISRCQEAIKYLGLNEKRYSGPLVIHRTDNYKVPQTKNKSPLTRMPAVVFPFTQQQIKREHKATFTGFINQLLQKIGLMQESVVDVEKPQSPTVSISLAGRNISPPPPPLLNANRNSSFHDIAPRSVMLGSNQLSKMVQTDVFKCESCEKRKKIIYKTSSVQCGGDTASFSVSTQVTESDFYSKIPITQSLASLTPAQLLAKSRSGLSSLTSPTKFSRGIEKDDSFGSLRGNFSRSADTYGPSRYSPPSSPHYSSGREEPKTSPTFNLPPLRMPFIGGGGRGRAPQPNPPRPLAPNNNRFGYNYF